ncbi:hypothetical protein ABEG17_08365 [Pedococcus sp. KACC 23699]|uniref:Uncharacterized protein n=1 Tax=Pedococcus sp. KACC 23699 TaxID=3149228 RepID=A0AAU7JZ47_9MICO
MLSLTRKVAAAILATATIATGTVLTAPANATASTPTYTFFYTKLPNGKNVSQRWNPCQNITYKVNLAAVPSKYRSYALSTTEQAMAKITAVNGLKFTYKGATTEVPRGDRDPAKQSAEIIIAWTTPSKTDFPLAGLTAGYGGHSTYWWGTSANSKVTYAAATTRG